MAATRVGEGAGPRPRTTGLRLTSWRGRDAGIPRGGRRRGIRDRAPAREARGASGRVAAAIGVRASWELHPGREPARHSAQRIERGTQSALSGGGWPIELLAPSASLRSWISQPRRGESLVLEAKKRRVDGAECDITPRALLDLVANRDAVRFGAEPHEGQQHQLLELPKSLGQVFLRLCR